MPRALKPAVETGPLFTKDNVAAVASGSNNNASTVDAESGDGTAVHENDGTRVAVRLGIETNGKTARSCNRPAIDEGDRAPRSAAGKGENASRIYPGRRDGTLLTMMMGLPALSVRA